MEGIDDTTYYETDIPTEEQTSTQHTEPTTTVSRKAPGTTVIALAVSLGVAAILFVVFLALYVALKQRRGMRGKFSRPDTQSYMYEMSSMGSYISAKPNVYISLKAFVPRLADKDVQITDELAGEGRFGPMYNGVLKVDGEQKHVVYKTLKENTKERERKFFMDQLEIYSSFEYHKNVIRLYGACISSDHIFAAFEYADAGNMRQFLRQYAAMPESQQTGPDSPSVTPEFLLRLGLGVAAGMRHLASRGIVHRELAAKHIMMGDGLVPKVAGLNTVKAVNKHISLRWMAPEVMSDRMYTLMSDVWSYGIVLWEMMSMGSKPYPNIPTRDIFLTLQRGTRMAKPPNCDTNVYSLMKWCWEDEPYERPTFLVLTKTLEDMIESLQGTSYMYTSQSKYAKENWKEAAADVESASYVTAHSMHLNDGYAEEIVM